MLIDNQVVLCMFVKRFQLIEDLSVEMTLRIASALHPWVQDKGSERMETLRQEVPIFLKLL